MTETTKYLKLLKASPPPLIAGEYNVNAKQKVQGSTFQLEQNFYISAPRFKLDSIPNKNVYPPNNKEGSYYKSIPHIIFKSKTLPWERTMDGNPSPPGIVTPPWLALLLLDEDEMKNSEIELKSIILNRLLSDDANSPPEDTNIIKPNITKEKLDPWDEKEYLENIEVTNSVEPNSVEPNSVEPNGVEPNGDDKTTYNVIDVPTVLFTAIAPKPEDLPFTAHARQISSIEGNDSTVEWSSVIIGNRLPTKDKRNTVFLISLEGHNENLNLTGEANKKIRLCVLHHWSFTAAGLDFESLVEKVNEGASLFRIEPDESITNETVKTALDLGYVPLDHKFRDGSNTVSWYRGPLVPLAMTKRQDSYAYESSDAVLRYDPNNGMFNTAYASAWELGRLLGLKNRTYVKALNHWRDNSKKETNAQKAKVTVADKLKASANPIDFEETQKKIERNELLESILFQGI